VLPPILASAVATGALTLTWDGPRVRGAKLDYHAEHATPFVELARALLEWPAIEGIDTLDLALPALVWDTPLLAARLGSLVTFRAWSTYETLSIDWLADHAPRLETLELATTSASGSRLWFPRLRWLEVFELRTPVEAYREARCPLLTALVVQPDLHTRSVEEADALLRAFPRLRTLTTNVADLPHARAFAERLVLAPELLRWTVSYGDDPPTEDEVRELRAMAPPSVELVVVGREQWSSPNHP
jgi:hypothetical protein